MGGPNAPHGSHKQAKEERIRDLGVPARRFRGPRRKNKRSAGQNGTANGWIWGSPNRHIGVFYVKVCSFFNMVFYVILFVICFISARIFVFIFDGMLCTF